MKYENLNEAINFDTKTIFIAIPKCGTTSIRQQLRPTGPFLIPNPHLTIRQISDSLYTFLLIRKLGGNNYFPNENVPRDDDIRAEARAIFSNHFKFSAVRNPWARAVSIYYRREGIQPHSMMSFEKFCENHIYASDTCLHPTLQKNQCDWLIDDNGKIIVDFVYKLEEIFDYLPLINKNIFGKNIYIKFANKNPMSSASSYQDIYNERTKRLIGKLYEKDIDLFNYAF